MELYSCRIIDMKGMEEGAGRGRSGFAKFLPFPLPNRRPEKVRFTSVCLHSLFSPAMWVLVESIVGRTGNIVEVRSSGITCEGSCGRG